MKIPDNAFVCSFHDEGGVYLGDVSASDARAFASGAMADADMLEANDLSIASLQDELSALEKETMKLREALTEVLGELLKSTGHAIDENSDCPTCAAIAKARPLLSPAPTQRADK